MHLISKGQRRHSDCEPQLGPKAGVCSGVQSQDFLILESPDPLIQIMKKSLPTASCIGPILRQEPFLDRIQLMKNDNVNKHTKLRW